MLSPKHLAGVIALVFLLPAAAAFAAPEPAAPRVSALYTTWDDYYFYAAAQVSDRDVLSSNLTPVSQPQQDDDVEVFFETDAARADVRTPKTFQMAVSAGGGAYFSVGAGTKIPKAKAVFTYKYAAGVDGTLNQKGDSDTGYTIELAIPWQQLGLNGPPKSGTVWGFNVISRDRTGAGTPASRFFSLSPAVQSAGDVQNPSKWTQIVFDSSGASPKSTPSRLISPHVVSRFPLINGSVVSGEWASFSRLAFGFSAIAAPAPTVAEEPNTADSPFNTSPTEAVAPPPSVPEPPVAQNPKAPTVIRLPGGGAIRIVPGGSQLPPPTVPKLPVAQNPIRRKGPKGTVIAGLPRELGTSPVPLTGSLTLGPAKLPALVMAIYRLDFNGDGRTAASQNVWNARGGSALADQPINGTGPWFSALRPLWHRQNLTEMRRAGIDVALVRAQPDDALLARELQALAEALQEMKAQGTDFPLVAADPDTAQAAEAVARQIPAEFRMTLPEGKRAHVSPGRVGGGEVVGRNGGQTYASSWEKATTANADFIVIDSWNDWTRGTEIAPSRQYGTQYADQTRLRVLQWNGAREWRTKYLTERTPRIVRPKVLYQVPVRVENAGTLPWRAGEGYSLSARWYKDGRLFDDSAPRIPVGADVLPGQSATLSVGLTARNSFGEDLEPGEYTLVFDMVQGQDRWFSFAGDAPLQVPVTVAAVGEPSEPSATFIGAQTPIVVQAGATYDAGARVRNDGGQPWPTGYTLAYKVQRADPKTGEATDMAATGNADIPAGGVRPGQIADIPVRLVLSDASGKPLASGAYRLRWFIQPGGNGAPVAGGYDLPLTVVPADVGASFVLSSIPRSLEAGREATAKLAVQNLGPNTWDKKTMRVGCHWYYLDGVEAQWDGEQLASLTRDVPPGGIDGAIAAKFKAPDQPGRYALVWDMKTADGAWASTASAAHGTDMLQVFVTVGGKGAVIPVDLAKYADTPTNALDGAASGLPRAMLPPDATAEMDANPLLVGKPGPPLYPSGFYASQSGKGWESNHAVSFLYGAKAVQCAGQTLDLPPGNYKTLHLLAASTTGRADITLRVGSASQTLTVSDWGDSPGSPNAAPAFVSPYRDGKDGASSAKPAVLGDYALPLNAAERISTLTLPNAPGVKILALTLEK